MTPSIIIGTFGNTCFTELYNVVEAGISHGISAFDTAPSYGTEGMLGKVLRHCIDTYHLNRSQLFVSDKIDAWQMQKYNGKIDSLVKKTIIDMGIQYLDILFIHWPIEEYLPQTWENMKLLKENGLVKEIGICNVRRRHLEKWKLVGISPKNVQIERHPLRTCQEDVAYCKDNGIKVYSYSPLCRMHQSLRRSEILQSLSAKYNKSIGQIILRWHLDSGTIPVFMSKNPLRIKENVDILGFSLTQEEISVINTLNCNYKIYLESWGCPGF